MASGSRLKAIRQRSDESLKIMRTFCLRPSLEAFERIKSEPAAKRMGPAYRVWVAAVIFKFGEEWGLEDTDDFPSMDADICTRAISEPSLTLSECAMYMFHATGELKYIDLYYQCIGNHHIPTATRVVLSREFKTAKSEYLEYLSDKTHPPLHKNVEMSSVDFTYFDGLSDRLKAQKSEPHPLRSLT